MKKIFTILLLSVVFSVSLECFSIGNSTYLPNPDDVRDCSDTLNNKKEALDSYIYCMAAIRYLDTKNVNDIKNIANVIKDCSDEIDAYDLKTYPSCLPNQAKEIAELDSFVLNFMKCTTDSKHEDDYIANYIFCHSDLMSDYNKFYFNQKEEKKVTAKELFGDYTEEENEETFDYDYVVPVEDEDDGYSLGDIGSKAGRAIMIILYTFMIIIFLIIFGIFVKDSFIKATDMKFIDVIKWSLQIAGAKFSKKNTDNFWIYAPYKLKEMGKKILDIMKGTGYIVIFCWFIGIFAIPIIGVINDEETGDIFMGIGIMFLAGLAAIIGIPLVRYFVLAIVGCIIFIFYCIPFFILCFIIGLLGYIWGKISKLFNPKKNVKDGKDEKIDKIKKKYHMQ